MHAKSIRSKVMVFVQENNSSFSPPRGVEEFNYKDVVVTGFAVCWQVHQINNLVIWRTAQADEVCLNCMEQ